MAARIFGLTTTRWDNVGNLIIEAEGIPSVRMILPSGLAPAEEAYLILAVKDAYDNRVRFHRQTAEFDKEWAQKEVAP